ncbi:MAG: hypothetical protein HZB56_04240 [Deltaproteobacteria bacterium]|nr:hypothetical protein [Deltaproteobacteria bacterium]
MRWATSIAAAALLAGCGNYSTEDLEFAEALPTRETLQVRLPGPVSQGAAAQAAVACGSLGEATGWLQARAIGVGVNAGLDWILRVVDYLRTVEPTRRERNARTWGPFPDEKHPGFQSRIRLTRTFQGEEPTYHFFFESLPPGGGRWRALITGDFVGAYAARGRGNVTLHFTVIRELGLNDSASDPTADVPIDYDRTGEPRTVSLTIPAGAGGFGLIDFPYTWSSYADGRGQFDFARQDAAGNRFVWQARFTADGAGRGDITIYPASNPSASYPLSACWDAGACYTAASDLFNVAQLCGPAATCVVNWPAGCPTAFQQ